MQIPVQIATHDKYLGPHIMGDGETYTSGYVIDVPGGAKLEYEGMRIQKAFGVPEVLDFIVEASTTIDLGLFSAWLYQKVNGKEVEKIIIRKRVITEITPENIRKVIEEEIEIGE